MSVASNIESMGWKIDSLTTVTVTSDALVQPLNSTACNELKKLSPLSVVANGITKYAPPDGWQVASVSKTDAGGRKVTDVVWIRPTDGQMWLMSNCSVLSADRSWLPWVALGGALLFLWLRSR